MKNILITSDNMLYEYNSEKYYSYELDTYKFAVVLVCDTKVIKEIVGFGTVNENAIISGRAYKLFNDSWDY